MAYNMADNGLCILTDPEIKVWTWTISEVKNYLQRLINFAEAKFHDDDGVRMVIAQILKPALKEHKAYIIKQINERTQIHHVLAKDHDGAMVPVTDIYSAIMYLINMCELPPGRYPENDKFYIWLIIRLGKLLYILSADIEDNLDKKRRSLPMKACIVWTRQGLKYSEESLSDTDNHDRVVVSTSATGILNVSPNMDLKAQANAIRRPYLYAALGLRQGQELPRLMKHEYGNCGEHYALIVLNHDNISGSLLCLAFNLDAVEKIRTEPDMDALEDISKLPQSWFSIFCKQCRILASVSKKEIVDKAPGGRAYAPSSDPAEKASRIIARYSATSTTSDSQGRSDRIADSPSRDSKLSHRTGDARDFPGKVKHHHREDHRSKEPSSGYGQHSRHIYPGDTGMISQRRTVNDGNSVLTSNATQEHDIDRISSTMEGLRLQDSRPYSGSVVNIPPPSGSAALRRDATSFTTTTPDAYGHPDNSTQYKPHSDSFLIHTDSQQESTQREPLRRHREVPPSSFPYGYDSTLPPRDQIDHGPSGSESNASGSRHHARHTSDRRHAGSSFPTDHSSGPSAHHYAAQGFTQSVSAPPADSRSRSGQPPQLYQSGFSSASGPITMHAQAADIPTGSIHYNDAVTEETGTVQQHNVSTAAGRHAYAAIASRAGFHTSQSHTGSRGQHRGDPGSRGPIGMQPMRAHHVTTAPSRGHGYGPQHPHGHLGLGYPEPTPAAPGQGDGQRPVYGHSMHHPTTPHGHGQQPSYGNVADPSYDNSTASPRYDPSYGHSTPSSYANHPQASTTTTRESTGHRQGSTVTQRATTHHGKPPHGFS